MVQDTFRRFAEEKLAPIAEHIHRENDDIPEDIISGLAEMGAFGLSIAEEYGGFASGDESDYIGMVVSTEELSRGSLGAGGSLVTRPEILARALEAGGTEAQKQEWLPKLASAEIMNAVAVTEPDYGSDVAGIKFTASKVDGGYLLNGVKTWCTFGARADVLMVLARTDPDRSIGHRGLSMFIVPKERGDAHGFELASAECARHRQDGGAPDRHDRLPRHALLRDRDRELVRARREPDRRGVRHRARLLLPDGRVRERAAPDRCEGARGHAVSTRGGPPVLAGPRGVRRADPPVPVDPGEARAAWP